MQKKIGISLKLFDYLTVVYKLKFRNVLKTKLLSATNVTKKIVSIFIAVSFFSYIVEYFFWFNKIFY